MRWALFALVLVATVVGCIVVQIGDEPAHRVGGDRGVRIGGIDGAASAASGVTP